MTPAELSVMKMIRQSRTWVYWCFSCRGYAALKRLKKAGVIEWRKERFPYWRFVIKRRKQ
jgi:hypothetical protein